MRTFIKFADFSPQTVTGAITPKSQLIPAGDYIPPEIVDLQVEHGLS